MLNSRAAADKLRHSQTFPFGFTKVKLSKPLSKCPLERDVLYCKRFHPAPAKFGDSFRVK